MHKEKLGYGSNSSRKVRWTTKKAREYYISLPCISITWDGSVDDVVRTQVAQPERDFTVEEFETLLHALEHNSDSDQWIEPMRRLVDDELIEALKTIPSKYRAALLLQHVTELSYEEIAETMNCKMGTVMSRLSRAREALKEALIQQNKSIGKKLLSIEHKKSRTSGHIMTNTPSAEEDLSVKKEGD